MTGQASALTPWHMWGTHVRADTQPGGGLNQRFNQQIARINYKRPETWSFFLGARIVGGDLPSGAGIYTARINILFGVGRSVFDTAQNVEQGLSREAFATFRWDFVGHTDPPQEIPFSTKYTTQVQTPPMLDAIEESRQTLEWLPAEDIQVQSTINHAKGDPADFLQVELSAFFAPRSHMRADWFNRKEGHKFLGDETGGS